MSRALFQWAPILLLIATPLLWIGKAAGWIAVSWVTVFAPWALLAAAVVVMVLIIERG